MVKLVTTLVSKSSALRACGFKSHFPDSFLTCSLSLRLWKTGTIVHRGTLRARKGFDRVKKRKSALEAWSLL